MDNSNLHRLDFSSSPNGRPGEVVITVKLQNGETLWVDTVNVTKDRSRDGFVKKLCEKCAGLDSKRIDAELLKIAGEVALKAGAPPTIQGKALAFPEPDPWPQPVEGKALLNELASTFTRFLVLHKGTPEALALWTVHTYCIEAAEHTPRIAATSPEKRCGKTRLLQVLESLVKKPLSASNITVSAIFRTLEQFQASLLADEADTFLHDREELRGILNAGHARGGTVVRTVGDDFEPRVFRIFAPVAIALIGRLPTTLEDRSIVIPMRRKKKGERVERFRLSKEAENFLKLRRMAARWAKDHLELLRESDPEDSPNLDDRAADNWRPLLAIAAACGGDWLARAREAAGRLSAERFEDEGSLGVQLLEDLQGLFNEKANDRLATEEILTDLGLIEERPWAEFNRGKRLSPQQLAKLLNPFGIVSRSIRLPDGRTPKGYLREDFEDAFQRYLASGSSGSPSESATPPQSSIPPASGTEPTRNIEAVVADSNHSGNQDSSALWRSGGSSLPFGGIVETAKSLFDGEEVLDESHGT